MQRRITPIITCIYKILQVKMCILAAEPTELGSSDAWKSEESDLELALVIADGEQEAILAGLQIRPLLAHQLCQQLLLQTGPCHCEVDQGDLDAHLRQVMGVGQGGGHVQLETGVVLYICIS